jgi:poly-gamma-glutamate synthesis protein (capsule biosynthesis protein)
MGFSDTKNSKGGVDASVQRFIRAFSVSILDGTKLKRRAVGIVGLIIAISLFSACDGNQILSDEDEIGAETGTASALTRPSVGASQEEPVSVSLLCAGDVMVHEPQLVAQFDNITKEYDFKNNFQYIKAYASSVDLALCNLETTLGGSPYTGYPRFSSPGSLIDALADAGFDVLFTSNNHMLDRGADGLLRTIEGIRASGLENAGSQYENEKNYIIVSAGAINAGIVSYTYESPRIDNTRTLNGLRITDELLPMINSFGYEDIDGDLEEMEAAVASARRDGADIVICYFHWGNEYQRSYDETQRFIANRAAIAGADVIFASHPHVLQGMEIIEQGSKRTPVFYSMGNFISNQRTETTGSMYTEQGAMAVVEMKVLLSSKKITSMSAKVIPTWLDKYYSDGKQTYVIVPLDGDFLSNPSLQESGHTERAAEALEYSRGLFGLGNIYRLPAAAAAE